MARRCLPLSMFLCVLLASSALAGKVYKWVDEDGNVHFGDRPNGEAAEQIELREAPPGPAASPESRARRRQRVGDVLEQERIERKRERAKQRELKAERKRNCLLAQDQLRRYREATYLYDLDASGERRILSTRERAGQVERARKSVKRWCE